MYDSHVHTSFSADCETPIDEVLEAAIQLNMKSIAITDHIDYKYHNGMKFEFDTNEYDNVIKEKQQAYAGQIEILKGVELGIKSNVIHLCESLMKKESFDFVIASMHGCEGQDFYFGNFFEDKRPLEAMQVYLREMLDLLSQFSDFDIIGHIDLPKRYNEAVGKVPLEKLLNLYKDIFYWLVKNNKGIEINTSGYRQTVGRPFPDIEILRVYYACGGRIVTLGSDSHNDQTLCKDFDKALDMLHEIGFDHICTFKDRRPRFHLISDLKKQLLKANT